MWPWRALTSISFTFSSSICWSSASAWSLSSSCLLSSSAFIRSSASLRAVSYSFSYRFFSFSSVASCYMGPNESRRSVSITCSQQSPSLCSAQRATGLVPTPTCLHQSRPPLNCVAQGSALTVGATHASLRGTWGSTQHSAWP